MHRNVPTIAKLYKNKNKNKRERERERETWFGPSPLSFPQFSNLICVVFLLDDNQTPPPSCDSKSPSLSLYRFSLWSNLCGVPSESRSATTEPPSDLQRPQTSFSVFWSFDSFFLSIFFISLALLVEKCYVHDIFMIFFTTNSKWWVIMGGQKCNLSSKFKLEQITTYH